MITASMARLREVHAYLVHARRAELLPYAAAGTLLLVSIFLLGEEAHRHIGALEAWVTGMGSWGTLVFVMSYSVLCSLFVPDVLLGLVAGAVFGLLPGLCAVFVGTLAGSALQYALSRHLLKPRIDRFLASRPALESIQHAVLGQEFRLQILIRLTPINRAMTSYVLGAAGVGFVRFMMACVAALPYLCIEVYAGYAGKHLALASGTTGGAWLHHDLLTLGGLGVAIVLMFFIARTARRAIEAASAEATAALAPTDGETTKH
ncbi:MAG: VTT domain-containing protein [Gammaproteobacteria bacterium]|nr:VTT domain-containing protein [Gammaproteobacteria bacterium]MBP6050723.1 VTT domain-containing protein [Pseudomonadales bacterium]MBK6584487.1 VTT domain-containing protein [Gammaproteobacteria bacterium]MBK7520946.1 VTT domain-containing protein [Gammaproteobacteria bacterium]MBK7727806.1 VTT domain-containing protein [Gammaproteobacteria bacterium]